MTHAGYFLEPLPAADQLDLVVVDIAELCTVHDPAVDAQGPRRGADLGELGAFSGAVLALKDGKVAAAGPAADVRAAFGLTGDWPEQLARVSADGRAVVPGYVDPHTHAVFGRTRQDEYERRLRGESYLEIAAAGGGIRASVRDLRQRSEEDLVALAIPRLERLRRGGTTTVEIKSGYGLSLTDELKMLRVARRAAAHVGLRAVLTCLAAHEIPDEYRARRAEYVALVCDEVLPAVVDAGLAERCDVFCEPTVFDLQETEVILRRAMELGLRCTVHADELEAFGGGALAARLAADSADHLIRIDEAGIAALAGAPTVATLLPGTAFTLGGGHYAPARRLIASGCAVALASDFNPGSCPIDSVPLIQAIACSQMKMSPAEALVATTLNAAWALGLAGEVGSLAPGKAADFLILRGDDHRLVPYHGGIDMVGAVYQGGRRVA
jgi:imidazolonepropionase